MTDTPDNEGKGELVPAAPATAGSMDDRQKRLVEGILIGESDQEAGTRAGYVSELAVRNGLRSKTVQSELREAHRARVRGSLLHKALDAVEELVTNAKTPAATRFNAAKLVIQMGGLIEDQDGGDDTPLHEMTPAQLERFIARAQAVVDGGGARPIITVTPDSGA